MTTLEAMPEGNNALKEEEDDRELQRFADDNRISVDQARRLIGRRMDGAGSSDEDKRVA